MPDLSAVPIEKLRDDYSYYLNQKMRVSTSLYPREAVIEYFDLKAWQIGQELRRRKEGSCHQPSTLK